MIVGRLLGWLILILGLVVLGRDLFGWLDTQRFQPIAVGELWFELNRTSLGLVQGAIQHYVWPTLWDPVITTVLLWWAFPLFVATGLVLVGLAHRPEGRSVRRRRR